MWRNCLLPALAGTLLALGLLTGCRPADQITVYSVPKADAIIPEGEARLTSASRTQRKSIAATPTRMLAAMFVVGESGWFFKATGDVEQLASQEEAFRTFLKSVRFENDQKPTWELPEGWSDRGERTEFRYTTLLIGQEKPVELAVSRLERAAPNETAFVLMNINRWRGQLGLQNIKEADLPQETELLEIDGKKCYVMNAVGNMAAGGGMRAPFAGAAATTSAPPETAANPPDPAASELKYDKPAGWEPGKSGQFRQAAFEVKDGAKQVEITVTTFPLGTGTLLANVNRWRDQVGLPPIAEANLKEAVTDIPIGNKEGKYVALLPSGAGMTGKGLLGVVLETSDRMWFVKLVGDAELAQREQANFEAFVKSLRVP